MEESQSRKYPDAPPTSDRRLNPRFPVKPIEYVEIGRTNGGIILDISREGMAVAAAQVIPGDQTLHFRFQLPRFPETIEAIAEISWIGETRKRAGFRFVNLPPRPRKQILDWITLQSGNTVAANIGTVSQEGPTTVSASDTSPSMRSQSPTDRSGPTIINSAPSIAPPPPQENDGSDPASVVYKPENGSNGKRPPVDRRSQSRKPLHSSTYLQFDDGNAGLLGDLSVAGLSFRAARALLNDEVIVTFQLPGSDQNIEAPACIVWKSASGKKAGARFTSLPHEAKNRISDWIHSRVSPAAAPAPDSSTPTADAASIYPTSIPTEAPPEYASSNNGNSIHSKTLLPDLSATVDVEPDAKFTPPPLPPPPTFRTSIFETTSPRATPSTNLVTPVAPVLPPLSGEAYYYVAPKESPSFLKVLGTMVLLGGLCFGAGFFYSRNHQTLLPTFATANSDPRHAEVPNKDSDTQRAAANPLSTSPVIPAPSEDPAVRDSATREISNSPEVNRDAAATSQFQNTQTVTQSSSTLSTGSQPTSSVADVKPSPSARTSSPKERAAARDTVDNFKAPVNSHTSSPFVPPATSKPSTPSSPSSYASTSSPTTALSKTSTNTVTSQTTPASSTVNAARPSPVVSSPAASPTSATPPVTTPATAPVTPPPVQPLTGSVSFFSRFRSIRNAPDPTNRGAGSVLQLGPLLSSPLPAYPADAQRKQIQGVVELDVFVGADGNVQEVHFIKGPAELADAALDAVRGWHYGSTVLGGRPVETEQSIFLTFKLGK
jgi:protein TonB